MIPIAEACECVLRFLRLAIHRKDVRIHSTKEYDTHWLITYAVPSLEDPSRIFRYGDIIAEKQTGYVYYFPSRVSQAIDTTEISSIRRGCTRITTEDMDKLEEEQRARQRVT